jgi:hypothetical protein
MGFCVLVLLSSLARRWAMVLSIGTETVFVIAYGNGRL